MAFFLPSGRMRVFTFAHFTSYIWRTASLIFSFVALMSTKKTSVLISSIFFMADSVVTGHWMILYLSINGRLSTDLRGYFGSRFLIRVFGLKKCMFVRTFFALSFACWACFFGAMAATEEPWRGGESLWIS